MEETFDMNAVEKTVKAVIEAVCALEKSREYVATVLPDLDEAMRTRSLRAWPHDRIDAVEGQLVQHEERLHDAGVALMRIEGGDGQMKASRKTSLDAVLDHYRELETLTRIMGQARQIRLMIEAEDHL